MMIMMMMMMRNVGFPETFSGFPAGNIGFAETFSGFPAGNIGFAETFSGFPAGNDLSGRKRLVFPFRSLNFALFREK